MNNRAWLSLSPRQLRSPYFKKHKGFCRYIVGATRKEIKEAFTYAGAKINNIESWDGGYKVQFTSKSTMVNQHEIYEQYPDDAVRWKLEEKLGDKIRPHIEWPR